MHAVAVDRLRSSRISLARRLHGAGDVLLRAFRMAGYRVSGAELGVSTDARSLPDSLWRAPQVSLVQVQS